MGRIIYTFGLVNIFYWYICNGESTLYSEEELVRKDLVPRNIGMQTTCMIASEFPCVCVGFEIWCSTTMLKLVMPLVLKGFLKKH